MIEIPPERKEKEALSVKEVHFAFATRPSLCFLHPNSRVFIGALQVKLVFVLSHHKEFGIILLFSYEKKKILVLNFIGISFSHIFL